MPPSPPDPSPRSPLISGGNASVYVSDLNRAIRFYVDQLGLPLKVRIADEWAEIDAGNGLVIGLHPAGPGAPRPGTPGAINIELKVTTTLDPVVDELKRRGVSFSGPIMNYENVRLASFSDPDGNGLLLAQVLN